MKVAFYTLGCKTNQFETQALERMFCERGHELVPFSQPADIYIVNTCTVTALADRKSRNAARRAKKLNPDALLIVYGCYAQMRPDEARELCGADIVLGSAEKERIVDIAEGAASPPVHDLWRQREAEFGFMPAGGLSGRTRALLKIQDGCQNFCTYCIIPYARGPLRSLDPDLAVAEAVRLAEEGYAEIVITGIEISSYGLENEAYPSLAALLDRLCAAVPGTRIRLGSLEPRTVNAEFVRICAAHGNICPHFHLSLQSGCDRTLRRMNRKYSAAEYLAACRLLRKAFPFCAITTDLIVGFPGETEADFEESLDFIRQCELTQVHVFPYSRRQGTPAHDMPQQLTAADKARRAARAADICGGLKADFMRRLVGQTLPVLFEQPEDGGYIGHCPQYCTVWAAGDGLQGKIREVRLLRSDEEKLYGEII
ncbi:MAG: tRNA (N(6)-L-threonylcarbamoyladenosine(37)-C(2))-methylthiotransferase MtaB [Clostridia bacterium]|nr:tRNA (N(6)-L-threonylcarbamoyladenosine(37)-C(2))-methylthiotransferase MtaB [Clostridia bacterium]